MSTIDKTKILYVITQTEWGGAQKYVFDLATSLEAKNCQIYVAVGRNGDRALIERLRAENIEVIELKHLVRSISPTHDIFAIFELRRVYKQIKPDVVHLNSSMAGFIGSMANIMFGKIVPKVIYTAHGWVFNEPMKFRKKLLYLDLEIISSWFKNSIICVSDFDRQTAIKYKITKATKLVTIHNGLDSGATNFLSSKESKSKLNLPSDKIIIGTIANFYETKGLEYFIHSISELKNDNVIGVIIGDGKLRPELERQIKKLKIENQIILLGKHADAAKYLKAFDIYVSASVKEGFPYAILEAMASGRPIVATHVGGVPEMINNSNGILVEAKNAKSLAEKIKFLIDNAEIADALAEQAEKDVSEKFSKEMMIKKTFELY